jgi:hypothetical protein
MWSEILGMIKLIKLRQPETISLQKAMVACPDHKIADNLLEKMEPEDNTPSDCREYRAFHALCKSCVHLENKTKPDLVSASAKAQDALRGFRSCGDSFNEGLVCRLFAIICQKQGKTIKAIAEFSRAIDVFTQGLDSYEAENDFQSKAECEKQIHECVEAIKGIDLNSSSSNSGNQTQAQKAKKQTWPTAWIRFGIHDFGQASQHGKYVMDDEQISEMTIGEVTINEVVHKLFSAQTGNSAITFIPGRDYRWLRVKGDSMNRATPTTIEPDDYILAELNRNVNVGDIVVASLLNPPTPAERAGLIKRNGGSELRSESEKDIEPIPISEVEIRGVVLAIAKPEEE